MFVFLSKFLIEKLYKVVDIVIQVPCLTPDHTFVSSIELPYSFVVIFL